MEGIEAGHVADTPGLAPGAAGTIEGAWLIDALSGSSDLVFAFDPFTIITWCNQACVSFLGHPAEYVIGRSIAEFIHPDDLERAAEVVGLTAQGAFDDQPITPALYRGKHASGHWVNLELNGSTGPDGSMLIVARVGGDLVLTDRLLEAMSGGAPFEEQVDLVLQMGKWRHPREGYAILYRDEDDEIQATSWNLPPELYGAVPVSGPTPWDAATAAGSEIVVSDLATEADAAEVASSKLVEAARAAGFAGCLAVPIADPDHAEGTCIVIWTTADGPTTSGHRYAMGNMRRAFALVLQQRSQVRGLEVAAQIDGLTGATSRARFMDLIDELGRSAHGSGNHALLYIDLDGFKAVNDSLGHAAGDLVLAETAARITDAAPSDAIIGRLGGDEFAVVCPPGTTVADAESLAQRVVDALAQPIEVGDGDALVGASVGLAIGEAGDHPASVLDAADSALLTAKAQGRGTWHRALPN